MRGRGRPVSPEARSLARAVAAAFGGTPSVRRYYDADESHAIDILSAPDRPMAGFTSFSTLGLFEVDNYLDADTVRVELAAIGESTESLWANLIATASFYVSKDRWLAAPGVTFPGVVRQVGLSTSLPHLFLAPPFPWPDLGRVLIDETLAVHLLIAIPIAESERAFLQQAGNERFEERLQAADTPYWSLSRPAVA